MRIIHDKNYTIEERKKYKPLIINNILDSINRLVHAMHKIFRINFDNEENHANYELLLEFQEKLKSDNLLEEWTQNGAKYAKIINSIWTDESIKFCYKKRNQFYLTDSTE
jgi:hypothetical protein